MNEPLSFYVNQVLVRIFDTKQELGEAAAQNAASILRETIGRCSTARIIVGTGNSQNEVIASLATQPRIDWNAVEVFHMDEYAGMTCSHRASFRRWLDTHLVDLVHPGKVHYIQGEAPDLDEECRRYAALLAAAPIDLVFFGIGENGHIAFNEPGVADFNDSVLVKRIALDDASRRQQVGEGHFASVDEVPREAITITCPAIAGARYIVGCVPDLRKAEAVYRAISGGLTPACPASMVFRHPSGFLYLDKDSASLLGTSA